MSQTIRNGLTLLTLAGLAAGSQAQWVGTSIHPGGNFSAAYGASNGIALGNSGTNISNAGYWTNSGSTFTSLHNNDWTSSIAYAGNMNMQVGGVQNPGNIHAARWFGTIASFEDMNPTRASHSEAVTAFGTKFAGWAAIGGENRGLLWHGGGNDDYTDLTPSWAVGSSIYGMDGSQLVGYVSDANFNSYAGYWTDTADSFVDLTPMGADGASTVAVAAGRQGGKAMMPGQSEHAYLWSGTAASGVDLHPDGFEMSEVNGMSTSYQVGATYFMETNLHSHAAFWSSTKNSWVDLHPYLTPGFMNSEATSVVEYADRIEVYGFAQREFLGDDRFAVMWTMPVPEPGSFVALALGLGCLLKRKRRA